MEKLLSLEEIVEQKAIERNASEEEKTEFYQKAKLAREKARQVDWFLSLMLDPEKLSRMKILEVLTDGKARSWGQAEKETGLSPTTLSKALKRMAKDGWVTREIKKTFPPRSVYRLNGWTLEMGKFLRILRRTLERNFFETLVEDYSDKDYEKIIESVRQALLANINNEMRYSLEGFVKSGGKDHTIVFFSTICQLLFFWSCFLTLTQNEGLAKKAYEIFNGHEREFWEELEMTKRVLASK